MNSHTPRSRVNLRRAFRSDRLRGVYDRAIAAGWTARVLGNGHVGMYAPDGTTQLTLSITANDTGRAAQNSESALKRWLKENQR